MPMEAGEERSPEILPRSVIGSLDDDGAVLQWVVLILMAVVSQV